MTLIDSNFINLFDIFSNFKDYYDTVFVMKNHLSLASRMETYCSHVRIQLLQSTSDAQSISSKQKEQRKFKEMMI